MQSTLAFAPTAEDLEDDFFVPPVLTFAPRPSPDEEDQQTAPPPAWPRLLAEPA